MVKMNHIILNGQFTAKLKRSSTKLPQYKTLLCSLPWTVSLVTVIMPNLKLLYGVCQAYIYECFLKRKLISCYCYAYCLQLFFCYWVWSLLILNHMTRVWYGGYIKTLRKEEGNNRFAY